MFSRFLSPTKHVKHHVRLMTFLGGIFALADILTIETFRWVTTSLENSELQIFIYAIIAFAIIETIDLIFHRWFKHKDRKAVFAIDKEVYDIGLRNYLALDHNYADSMGLGRLQSVYQKGMNVRLWLLYRWYLEGGKICVSVVGALGILFYTHILSGLGAIAIIVIILRIFRHRNKKERRYRKRAKEKSIELNKVMVMQMMSKFEILQSDRTEHEMQRYASYADDLCDIHTQKGLYNFVAYHAVFSIFNYLQIAVYGFVGYLTFTGVISLADFFVIALSFRLLSNILGDIRGHLREYSKEIVHLEKLRDVMDSGPKLQGIYEGSTFQANADAIHLKDIVFGYDDEIRVFDGFTCTLQGGKKTALVGVSGSGKSTLIKLIAGYLRPIAGSIIIGEQSLTDISLKSYYKHVGYLTQEPLIFDGSIWENLTYALDIQENEEILKQKIDDAIRLAHCAFIYDFPDGLHTEIGERGIRLSGGQRQRLAIAKVFLKDPSIILLDEPTSALDSFSEETITQAMQTLFEGRTVIIIAHRLQTVKAADDILVFEEGTIQERGTHTELIAKNGIYANMLELQSGF